MRLDSPFVLAVSGAIALHVIALVAGDAMTVLNPPAPPEVAPRIEMVDIQPLPPPPPEPPRPALPTPPTEPPKDEPATEQPKQVTKAPVTRPRAAPREAPVEQPPTTTEPTSEDSGGEQVVKMDDLVPTQNGVPVAPGPSNRGGRTGRGGAGGGTGRGIGTGGGDEPPPPPPPVSVATIKTRAMPKGDFGYIDAGRDYPPEARRLGIQGPIKVRLLVDKEGKVRTAVLLNKLGGGLDELALARARLIQFEPAKDTDDKAVASVVIWTFNMTLPK